MPKGFPIGFEMAEKNVSKQTDKPGQTDIFVFIQVEMTKNWKKATYHKNQLKLIVQFVLKSEGLMGVGVIPSSLLKH